MITLVSAGGAVGTPKPGTPNWPVVASWSPSVGSVTLPMSLTSAPPGVTSASFQTFALGVDGIWRPDPSFLMTIGGPGGGCDGCTSADQLITSVAGWPALVPITLSYASGNFAAPPPPPQRVVYARTVIALGFGGLVAPAAGSYIVGLG